MTVISLMETGQVKIQSTDTLQKMIIFIDRLIEYGKWWVFFQNPVLNNYFLFRRMEMMAAKFFL